MITKEQAKQLTHRQVLYHVTDRNADGTPVRWRVNGKVKTWKRSPGRFQVPIKHGLRSYDYLTEHNAHLLCLTEAEAKGEGGDVMDEYAEMHEIHAAVDELLGEAPTSPDDVHVRLGAEVDKVLSSAKDQGWTTVEAIYEVELKMAHRWESVVVDDDGYDVHEAEMERLSEGLLTVAEDRGSGTVVDLSDKFLEPLSPR